MWQTPHPPGLLLPGCRLGCGPSGRRGRAGELPLILGRARLGQLLLQRGRRLCGELGRGRRGGALLSVRPLGADRLGRAGGALLGGGPEGVLLAGARGNLLFLLVAVWREQRLLRLLCGVLRLGAGEHQGGHRPPSTCRAQDAEQRIWLF